MDIWNDGSALVVRKARHHHHHRHCMLYYQQDSTASLNAPAAYTIIESAKNYERNG